jgi:hypothetical protein
MDVNVVDMIRSFPCVPYPPIPSDAWAQTPSSAGNLRPVFALSQEARGWVLVLMLELIITLRHIEVNKNIMVAYF